MTRIMLIRHGETDWNVHGRYQGQADPGLNQKGIQQSHTLAVMLDGKGLDRLYTSPLLRAAQTAEILAEHLRIPLHRDERLMEIHQGDWQTRLRSEIEQMYPELFSRWETEPWEVTPPGGEHLSQVQERVYAALDDMIRQYPADFIGVVTHRIPIALIKYRYQDQDRDIVRTIHLPNAYFEEIQVNAWR
jgi:broad specificity phosphatase PhoE